MCIIQTDLAHFLTFFHFFSLSFHTLLVGFRIVYFFIFMLFSCAGGILVVYEYNQTYWSDRCLCCDSNRRVGM